MFRAFYASVILAASSVAGIGQNLQLLYSFSGATGMFPAALTLADDGSFSGTCRRGGVFGTNGTVFKITTNGTCELVAKFAGTNGTLPNDLMEYVDGNFYGTTVQGGGTSTNGTVFVVTTNGIVRTLV